MSNSRGVILTADDQEEILELHRQGLSNMEITRRTGKSYPSAAKAKRENTRREGRKSA